MQSYYYGKNGHHLNVRSGEYLGVFHLTAERVDCKLCSCLALTSVVSDHFLLHGHNSDFNDFIILSEDNNSFKLYIKHVCVNI